MKLEPVKARSLSDSVYEQLRDAILAGEIAVGELLPSERKLAEMLEVNRGAVREALKRLEQDQLIAKQQGELTRVLDFRSSARLDLLAQLLVTPSGEIDETVMRSVAELRCAITPDIARLAALRLGPKMADQFTAAVADLEAASGQMTLIQHRVESFWALLAEASQNVAYRLLNNTIRAVHQRFFARWNTALTGTEFENVSRYRSMAEAVVAGHADEAYQITRKRSDLILEQKGIGGSTP